MLSLYHQPHPRMISMRMWAHASSWNLILPVASQTRRCRKHNDAGNKCRKHDGYRKHDGAGNMMVHVPHMYQPEHAYMHSNTFQCMRSDSFAKTLHMVGHILWPCIGAGVLALQLVSELCFLLAASKHVPFPIASELCANGEFDGSSCMCQKYQGQHNHFNHYVHLLMPQTSCNLTILSSLYA